MSGSTFKLNGSGGASANTLYFGYVPDKFNMLIKGSSSITQGPIPSGPDPANLISNWTAYNTNLNQGSNVVTSSFGSTTTAPDGSSNATKLVESATNTVHACETILYTLYWTGGYTLRLSVFAKAAERTRIALYMGTGELDQNNRGVVGCKTVFDLAGGQIGVANTAFGSPTTPYVPGPTEIVPFPNGWYRCTMESKLGTGVNASTTGFVFGVLLDSGSGTGADSTSYSGTGTSGAYLWRTTMLPPAAWGIQNVTFFDDFLTTNTIDLAQTKDPTKKWFTTNTCTGFPSDNPSDPTKFSISSPSILKIATPSGQADLAMETAIQTSGTNFVGQVFQPSMLAEVSMAWDQGPNANNSANTLWTQAMEALTLGGANTWAQEVDFFESHAPSGGAYPLFTVSYGIGNTITNGSAAQGYPIWYNNVKYRSTSDLTSPTVAQYTDGITYTSLITDNLNNIPPSVPADWGVFSSTLLPTSAAHSFDYNQQHTYSTLWLAYRGYDAGFMITFFDGRFCFATSGMSVGNSGFIAYYAPNNGSAPLAVGDSLHYPIFIGTAINLNCFIDWVRVTQ